MWRIAVLIIPALAVTGPVQARSGFARQAGTSQQVARDQAPAQRGKAFSPAERNLIRAHLGARGHATPQPGEGDPSPGLQRNATGGGALPPGWQKEVTPGRSLDYHVYRQGQSLPVSLMRRLPQPPAGTEILQIRNKVVLLNSATKNILDVFDLAPAR
jgi:hypothetical protein